MKPPREILDSPLEAASVLAGCQTWNPIPHGRTDYVFCLWEADKPEDVEATLRERKFLDYMTLDSIKVEEIDGRELAKTV